MKYLIVALTSLWITTSTANAGGLLGLLLFGSLDATQSACQAQHPGDYLRAWKCIRARVAEGHTGDMNNGAALKYMATGDMLYATVTARKMDNVTALYHLGNALSQGDMEYEATHPHFNPSTTCHSYGSDGFGYTTHCY